MQLAEDTGNPILIVEDEGLIAADVQRKLEVLGYHKSTILGSGEEALECARSMPFDLVLMDIRLKGNMDGIAAAHALKAELGKSVIYMTAHADQETINRAKVTEPFGYLSKPIRDADLRSVVEISLYKIDMERRLRTSQAWLSTTLRSVAEGLIATNVSGEIVFMNSVAEQLTGWSGPDAHGLLLTEVLGLFEGSECQPAKNPILDLEAGENRGYMLTSKAGARKVVEVECIENRPANNLHGYIVVVRDIGERKDREDRLVQSQRTEAVANLAGGLAHDFNDQLMAILRCADELWGRLAGANKEQALSIKQAASMAGSLTSQLQTVGGRDDLHPEVLNVNQAVREAQASILRSLGGSRTLATNLGSPWQFIRADRHQIQQLLLSLALNARATMPAVGELRMETSSLEIETESPAARRYPPGSYVRLRVWDTSSGVDQATLSRIFEPCFTAEEGALGTGLNLSVVHSIVVQSGGYISAASEIGKGTSFEILLPCIDTFRRLSEGSGSEDSDWQDPVPTVLLVEEDDGARAMTHTFLEREGYQVLEARNAGEAAGIAEDHEAPIHVLVADLAMPEMTGPELAERLGRSVPGIKVLFKLRPTDDVISHQGVLGEGAEYIQKPFGPENLAAKIREALGPPKGLVRIQVAGA